MRKQSVSIEFHSHPRISRSFYWLVLLVVAGLQAGMPVEAAPPALPKEYRSLAGELAMPLKSSPDQFKAGGNIAEQLSLGHTSLLSLKEITSSDRQIEYITRQTEEALTEILQRIERINAMPKPPGAGELIATSFIDGFFGNLAGGYARGAEAERMQTALKNEFYPLFGAMEKVDATQQMLATVAAKYAADFTYPKNRISVGFDESWGPVGPYDWVYLNHHGPTIRDATVIVKLAGADGVTRTNVHFVQEWQPDTWLYGRYEPGLEALGKSIGQTTVMAVQKVEVTIYSPRFSTVVAYTYAGAEKDADIAGYCRGLTFTGRYQPYITRRYLPDTRRGVEFTLEGLDLIPKCSVKVTFWTGLQSTSETWELDYWKKGDKKMFRPKEPLESDLTMATMVISFPGTTYKHQYSFFAPR